MAVGTIKTADTGDRTSAFRRARINTFFVRIMRWLLPAAAVLLTSTYGIFMQRTMTVETANHAGKLNTGTVSTDFNNLAMADPSYEGYNKKDGSRYRVSAKTAITDLSRDKPVRLLDIDGSLTQRNGQRTLLKARRGLFDQQRGRLNLDGGINVAAPNGMEVLLSSAVLDTKTSEIMSNEPVVVRLPSGELRGNSMHLNQRTREVIFNDGVKAQLRPGEGRANTRLPQANKPAPGSVLGFGGDGSNAPVDITSVRLSIAEAKYTALFDGNVRAVQSGRTLEAPELLVLFGSGSSLSSFTQGSGGAGKDGAGKNGAQGRLQRLTASRGVKLIEGTNEVRARRAVFDVEANQAELSGDVKITAAGGRAITARFATVDTVTRRVVLTGNVAATQASSLLRGHRLVYAPKLGRMNLTSPAVGGSPKGDIFVRFMPRGSQDRGWRPRRSSTSNQGAFTTNPDAPIEITARSLDVRDLRSQARFEGGVRARQGDMQLTTPALTAVYAGRIGLFEAPSGKRSRAKGQNGPMTLRYIRATKPVTVTSGSDTSAKGDSAEFDVAANKVTLAGNVVLEQGRQIVRGDRLIIDLKTGMSRMKNAAPDKNTAKRLTLGAAPRITGNRATRDCGGQMCAVFYPSDAQKARAGKGPSSGATRRKPKLDKGWSASTTTN